MSAIKFLIKSEYDITGREIVPNKGANAAKFFTLVTKS